MGNQNYPSFIMRLYGQEGKWPSQVSYSQLRVCLQAKFEYDMYPKIKNNSSQS